MSYFQALRDSELPGAEARLSSQPGCYARPNTFLETVNTDVIIPQRHSHLDNDLPFCSLHYSH